MDILLNYVVWNPDPEIFSIGSLSIRWYGLMWALSFFIGYLLLQKFYKDENLSIEELDKLALYIILGSIIGARLGHVFFYQPEEYLTRPLDILKIWEGGLASHGGAIGILIAAWFFVKKHSSRTYLWVFDRLVIAVALAGTFIRLGNLFNSEMIGRPTDVPWAFIFPLADPANLPRHPTQIYEALCYLLIFFILLVIYFRREKKKTPTGVIFGIFLILLFTARFFVEFYKELQVDFEATMLFNMGQLLSIPFIIFGIFLLVWSLKKNRFKSDVIERPIAQKGSRKGGK
jgi:phosphatidylglycerol---prolipoprotein diacylglyceryl transferase